MRKNKKQKRIAVYIDGSNLYYKLRDLNILNTTYFRYGNFAALTKLKVRKVKS